MRILHLTDDFSYPGGIQSYLKHVRTAMSAQGHEIRIYSPAGRSNDSASYFTRWCSPRDALAVRKLVREWRPDILHAHSLAMRLSPFPLRVGRSEGIPVVMTVHDFAYVCPRKWMIDHDGAPCRYGFGGRCLVSNCPSSKPGWRWLLYHQLRWLKTLLHRSMLRRYVDRFVCPSRALGDWMERSLSVPNVVHISNFIAGEVQEPAPLPERPRLLFVGRLSEEKGVDCLLRAMPEVLAATRDAELVIVGDGPLRGRLEASVKSLGIGARTHFEGQIANERLGEYYARAAICVLPSVWMENCPVTALEALAAGRPLVVSDAGGSRELVREGETGFVFRRGDVGDLARKLVTLAQNRALRENMSREAHALFCTEYTEARHLERLMALYKSAMTDETRKKSM